MDRKTGPARDETSAESVDLTNTAWCFDMELYYNSLQSNGTEMIARINQYKEFSFRVNGMLTLAIILIGFIGSFALLQQIRGSRFFSRRLAVHVAMLCMWDGLLLLSCLLTYCIPSLIYCITPYYGPLAYVLFVFQPVASMCVSGTIWQVLAITTERYLAVTRPLEQRTRKAQFGVRSICAAIAVFCVAINLMPVPFDRALVPCFEITSSGEIRRWTLLKPYDDDETKRKVATILHIIPDILFRAPLPIIVIAFLTVKTIQVCNQRTFGPIPMNMNSPRSVVKTSIPLRLSLLSFKFILCNSLYMFNSILIEVLGIGRTDGSTSEGDSLDTKMDQYMNSFYLSDASNMLLVLHSATNWLIFYHWPRFRQNKNSESTMSTSNCVSHIHPHVINQVLKKFGPAKQRIGVEIVTKLCGELPPISEHITGRPFFDKKQNAHIDAKRLNHLGGQLGDFIEQALKWFSDRSSSYVALRELCRKAGQAHYESNIHLTADQWKLVRAVVVRALLVNTLKKSKEFMNTENIEENLTRAFNFILSETRSGLLCASVEATQQMRRSRSSFSGWKETANGRTGGGSMSARPLMEYHTPR